MNDKDQTLLIILTGNIPVDYNFYFSYEGMSNPYMFR